MNKKKNLRGYRAPHLTYIVPQELSLITQNPMSIMMANISFKQLFTLSGARMHESFLLNGMDHGINSFELKLGFGNSLIQDKKVLEHYYFYNIVAQMSGVLSLNPYRIISQLQLYCLASRKDILESKYYTEALLRSIMLWAHAYIYKIKQISPIEKSEQMKESLDFFFTCFDQEYTLAGGTSKKINRFRVYIETKHLDDLFFLFEAAQRFCQRFEGLKILTILIEPRKQALPHDEYAMLLQQYHANVYASTMTSYESNILRILSVHETLHETFYRMIGKASLYFFTTIIDLQHIKKKVSGLASQKYTLEDVIFAMTDIERFQKKFFFASRYMALKSKSDEDDVDLQEELEDFFENIKEDGVFQVSSLPELIKKQSLWMHLCMQYYVHSVSDTFSHTLVYQPSSALGIVTTQRYESLQENLQSIYSAEQTIIDTIKKQYAANGAFHTTAYIHILKRIEAFTVPFFPTHTSDATFDMTLLLKTCLGVFLQDCLPRHVQITATNKEIKHFQGHFQPFLDTIFAEKNDSILITYYEALPHSTILSKHLSDTMVYRFTNHIYTLEAMLWYEMSSIFQQIPELACLRYSTFQVVPLSIMKQTILGVCILYNFLQYHFPKCEHTSQMMEIYHELIVREIRCMPFVAMRSVSDIYITMAKKYTFLLDPLTTDERTMFHCQCIMESLHEVMTKKKDANDTSITIGHEDIVWLKHCLVTIQGYARKFYIPTH